MYLNNHGAGFADFVNVEDNTTVQQFFSQQMPEKDPQDYLIRVNRQPVSKDYVLAENDRVTITPTKIEGAVL
jgi:sulfur carrier protein ThiS